MQDVISEIEAPISPAPTEEQTAPVEMNPVTEDEFEFVSDDVMDQPVKPVTEEPAADETPAEVRIGEPDNSTDNGADADVVPVDDTILPPPPPPPPPPEPDPVPVPNTLVSYGPFGFVSGTDGMDVILAYGFRTIASGGGGDDTMIAFNGTGYFRGGDGNDVLIGGTLGDTLFGDDGNDQLLIGAGDFAVGGTGADQFIFSTTDKGKVIVSDFDATEGDMLVFSKGPGVTCNVIENVNNTEIAFSDGLTLQLFGVTADDVMANPDMFGL